MSHNNSTVSKPLRVKRGRDMDMTQGNIASQIIRFSAPLLLGNLFQQLYNTVDTWVIGNFVENEFAFSAVGTVGPVINMLIGTFMGLSTGTGVVISQFYGAKRMEEVSKTVHTAIVMTVILGVLFTVLGIVMTPFMLDVMKMPADVQAQAIPYLTIYFSGILGLMLYNMGSGILRAVGDSTRPFYFLVVCALLNTGLDLLFVIGFEKEVEGVALATILSQAVSALLVMILLFRTSSCVRVRFRSLRIDFKLLLKIIRVGIPASLQMAVTAFSNIFVQSYVNYFGPDCMSGWTAYAKVDQLLFLPMQSISLGVTTFVGQNLGKGQVDRAKKGVKQALFIALGATFLLMVPVVIFARPVVSFFNDDPDVIYYGSLLLTWISPFYLLCCFNQIFASGLRGAGNSKAPMIIMLCSFVAFRQIYLFGMSHIWNEIIPIAMAYPSGWLLCSLLTGIYYQKTDMRKTRLIDDTPESSE